MPVVRRFDHLAVVVEDIEQALGFWRDALGLTVERIVEVPEQQSEIAFLPLAGAEIELVRPTDAESGVARYLQKRGPGMHHICLEVDDLPAMLERLRRHKVRLIHDEPLTADDGKRLAFIHPEAAHGVLVELYQLPSESA